MSNYDPQAIEFYLSDMAEVDYDARGDEFIVKEDSLSSKDLTEIGHHGGQVVLLECTNGYAYKIAPNHRDSVNRPNIGAVKVNLFTTELEPLGTYESQTVPREGEFLHWEGESYQVKTVDWENLDEDPQVQIRVGDQ